MKQSYSAPFVIIAGVFCTCLIVANIIAVKFFTVGPLTLTAGIVIFPVSYIFGDVLTEVYGFRKARLVIWLGFGCNLLAVMAISIGQALPPAGFWSGQGAYETILGYSPRLLAASFLAYLVGEFANSVVLARMKILTQGRWLWIRTIGSTIVGEGLDSLVFMLLAFSGTIPANGMISAILAQWWFKTGYEALATPLTYAIVNKLKQVEGYDFYDVGTHFVPLEIDR